MIVEVKAVAECALSPPPKGQIGGHRVLVPKVFCLCKFVLIHEMATLRK